MSVLRRVICFSIIIAAFAALAQDPSPPQASPEPRFEIRRFVVEGATLLTPEEIDGAIQAFTGLNKDFADVQRALEALERAYTEKGFSAVQVILPEQELAQGEVRFKIIEARVAKLLIEGNKFFDEANIRASLPSVAPGRAPNIRDIADNLRVANESPAKQTTVLLRGGAEEGQVDAVVRVSDERPIKFSMTIDNTGTEQTGTFRVGFGFQHANLWNRDHVLSMQYVTSPTHSDAPNRTQLRPNHNVFILGASYRIPLYRYGDSMDLSVGYSNVNSGVVQNLFNVSGSGTILGLRYNMNLQRWGEIEQRLAFGLDWRAYNNRVTIAGGGPALVPDVTVHPISATYFGLYRAATSETSFNLGVFRNLPGGNDGHTKAFAGSPEEGIIGARAGAEADYFLWRYGFSHLQAFANDWQMRFGLNGQMTRDKLVAGEQFGVGGADSVRGFLEREVTNDNGFRGTLEFYTPDYAATFPLPSGSRLRSLFFYDWALTRRFQPALGELNQSSIGSFGLGIRYSRGTNTSLRVDYGIVTDAGGVQGRHEGRLHATFTYIF